MITLQPFTHADYSAYAAFNPNVTSNIFNAYLSQWSSRSYEGRYFDMLAVVADHNLVGYCSLAETAEGYISEGIEIYPPYRRRGYAKEAVGQLLHHATALGCSQVYAQIRTDNTPSLHLHTSLGFSPVGEPFLNSRGQEVLLLVYKL